MIIREGTLADVPEAVEVVDAFVKEALENRGLRIDPEFALKEFERYVDYSMVAYEGDRMVGLIAGEVNSLDIAKDKIFNERVWFVLKEFRGFGKSLLDAMEKKLKDESIKFSVMVHLGGGNAKILERFYKSRGYEVMETHYIKQIEGVV